MQQDRGQQRAAGRQPGVDRGGRIAEVAGRLRREHGYAQHAPGDEDAGQYGQRGHESGGDAAGPQPARVHVNMTGRFHLLGG